MRVNSIVVGLGEVGRAVKEVIGKDVYGVDKNFREVFDEGDYLNVCIPYSPKFVNIVNNYIDEFKPKLTIIHSTVPVGTTKKINGAVVHSPVRGKHPNIKDGLQQYIKFVGYNDDQSYVLAVQYLEDKFNAQYIYNTDNTEFMKLASLAKYCAYLAVADELNGMCEKYGINYEHIKSWDRTQNEYINNYYPDMKWPIIDPPKGKIGGHCVLPVTEMFLKGAEDVKADTSVVAKAFKKYNHLALH